MDHPTPAEFRARRARQQERLLEAGTRTTKRFFNLDGAAYRDGELDARVKELLGLVASTVLRCDDCIRYHLDGAHAAGWSAAQLREALDVAMVVGGSITIPHLRRACEYLDALEGEGGAPGPDAA